MYYRALLLWLRNRKRARISEWLLPASYYLELQLERPGSQGWLDVSVLELLVQRFCHVSGSYAGLLFLLDVSKLLSIPLNIRFPYVAWALSFPLPLPPSFLLFFLPPSSSHPCLHSCPSPTLYPPYFHPSDTCLDIHAETRGLCQLSSSVVLYLMFWDRASHYTWRSIILQYWMSRKPLGPSFFYLPNMIQNTET